MTSDPPPPVLDEAARSRMPDPTTDLLGFLEAVAAHGDVVAFDHGGRGRVLVNDGEAAARFLRDSADDTREAPISSSTAAVTGDGLLTSVQPRWQPRRLVLQRALSYRQVRQHADLLASSTSSWLAGLVHGGLVDLAARITELTLQNLGDVVFASDFRPLSALMSDVLTGVLHTAAAANAGRSDPAVQQRLLADVALLDAHLGDLIDARWEAAAPGDDVLSLLVAAARQEDDTFHRTWVRDEAVTLVVAGHDTTALLTTMALSLLSRHPDVHRVLRQELRAARAAGVPDAQLPEQVPLVRLVLQEALRLYPPVPVLHRLATQDLQVGGYRIPSGQLLVFSAWVQHRDPRSFTAPLDFDPWRFSPERGAPGRAYLPFGAGRRICAGNHLATLQAAIIVSLVTLLADVDCADEEPALSCAVTLRLPAGLPARLTPAAGPGSGS
jgi:cytochrome P450